MSKNEYFQKRLNYSLRENKKFTAVYPFTATYPKNTEEKYTVGVIKKKDILTPSLKDFEEMKVNYNFIKK